jgi:hypothetical protein
MRVPLRGLRVALLVLLAACGVDPGKVPTMEIYGGDGEAPRSEDAVHFAVVGATRSVAYGARAEPPAPQETIADIRTALAVRGLDGIILTGGYVRRSTNDEWTRFGRRWRDVIASELSSDNKGRKPAMALPGSGEILGDRRLAGYGAAFPGIGTGIGFNRNASWGQLDLQVGDATFRLLFLDTHKAAMGSRWKEQLFWLPKAVSEGEYDRLIVFMPDPRVTLAEKGGMDRQDAPSELIEIIEEYAELNSLVAVISGGPRTNEVILPTGTFGEAYLVAANAGIDMPTLLKAGPADEAGYKDVSLEPLYVVALQREFDRRVTDGAGFPESVVDQARGEGSWTSYTPRWDGSAFPIQGWWILSLKPDEAVRLTFRMRRPDGTFFDAYAVERGVRGGWQPVPVSGP